MDQQASYREKVGAAVRNLILEFECQPILLIGSGISRRYFGAPNWHELLKSIFSKIPGGIDSYEYNRQKYDNDPVEIGTVLADIVFEWAWKDGRDQFPEDFFHSNVTKDSFLKFMVCSFLDEITPKLDEIKEEFTNQEILSLIEIRPHAIITTNYDMFLEKIFEGYASITEQTILKYNTNSFGEIFHIHGDVSDPETIVLTNTDYEEWDDKKKYVSAKLLTYFAEHPVFIFGYGLDDPNVKSILRDIGEIVADDSGLIPNVYQVLWRTDPIENDPPPQAIFSVDGRDYRVNAIHTNELKWLFEALKSRSALTSINPKLGHGLILAKPDLCRRQFEECQIV